MHKTSVVLTIACMMLCLNFNYTFPLQRNGVSKWTFFNTRNDSQHCIKEHQENIVDRTKIMAAQVKNSLSLLKSTNEDSTKTKRLPKQIDSNEDLSHFEQMIIKKKYPFIDLKQLEMKYHNSKDPRQSVDQGHSEHSFREESGFCEPLEEGPNVEITNRGLSGFAIPSKLIKNFNVDRSKLKLTENPPVIGQVNLSKKSKKPDLNYERLVASLENDIKLYFEEGKN